MLEKVISELFLSEGIELWSAIDLDECTVTRRYLLDRNGISTGSVIIMAVPYLSHDYGEGNVSEYAKCKDYHLYFKELFSRILPKLKEEFPQNVFCGFSDHSPINEREAAARAGLGLIGLNGLLITEKYSSFVFLGEIITDIRIEGTVCKIQYCKQCGHCRRACPAGFGSHSECLSSLTQKKGDLTEEETGILSKSDCVWGCDICQTVCPHTKSAIQNGTAFSHIPFFIEERLPRLTYRSVSEMSDSAFSQRAYAWRGRQTILRNLKINEDKLKRDKDCQTSEIHDHSIHTNEK